MVPNRVAAMIITIILDFQARRKARKAVETRYFVTVANLAIFCFRLSTLTRHYFTLLECPALTIPWLILPHASFLLCIVFNSFFIASLLHNAIRSFMPPRIRRFVQSRTVIKAVF